MNLKLLMTATLLAWTSSMLHAASPPDWLLGTWVLNNDLTVAAQAEVKSGGFGGFGMGKPTVAVGGMPIPVPGGTTQAAAAGTPRDPHVLRCSQMQVSMMGEDVHFDFAGVGQETLQSGEHLGRVTKWSRKKFTSRYETTSRKVSHTLKPQKDGTLLVTVKLKPTQGKASTFKRVFERPAP